MSTDRAVRLSSTAPAAGAPPARAVGIDTGRAAPLFGRLERQARTIERALFLLVGTIAIVPPVVFFVDELEHLRRRTAAQARFCANLIETHAEKGVPDRDRLLRDLQQQISAASLAFVRIVDRDEKPLVLLGDPRRTRLPARARASLPAAAAPMATIEVGVADAGVIADLLRVQAIHLVVALSLGFALHRYPLRALNRAIAQLAASQARLLHADRLSVLGQIYAGLAHEVNNPLGIILARVSLILSEARAGGNKELVNDLELIERHGARIAEIVRGLLGASRRGDSERRPLDLNGVVREVVKLVDKTFAKQNIRIALDLRPLPVLLGSSSQLEQVLLNLLSNARDAMPAGGVVSIRSWVDSHWVTLEVQDTGTGLAPLARERLFEPFFTTKEPGRGTGLGLFVSYGIVDGHGGEIDVESADGQGTTFRITLPAAG